MKGFARFAIALAISVAVSVPVPGWAQPKAEEEPAAEAGAPAKKDSKKKKKKKGKKDKKADADADKAAGEDEPAAAADKPKAGKGDKGDKAKPGKGDKPDAAGGEEDAAAGGEGDEPPMVLSTDPDAPTGSEENPDKPTGSIFGEEEQPAATVTAQPKRMSTEYPIEEVLRPLTLPQYMTEIGLDYPVLVDPFVAGGLLRGQFGITNEAQLGVAYGIGTATEDGYEVGKAAAIDFTYKIQSWIAGQLTVPMLFDPFAVGATVAVPMKFTFAERLSLVLGEELVSFRIYKLFPVVENAALTAQVADDEMTNTEQPDVTLRVGLRAIYQLEPKIAIDLRGRQIQFFPDEDTTLRNQFNFDAGLQYAVSNKFDVGVRLGWADMAEIDTFGGTLIAALRL